MRLYESIESIPADYWRWSPYVSPREWRCRGSGQVGVDEPTMDALIALRREYGEPFIITCGFRSPEHNAAVKGVRKSQHKVGKAVDIAIVPGGLDPHKLETLARKHGFRAFGFYQDKKFMHMDTRERRASWGKRWPEGYNRKD